MLSLPHSGTDVGDEYDIMDTERSDLTGVHSLSQSRNGGGGGSSASDQRQFLASLKQALGSALPMIREQDGGSSGVSSSQLQSMLELGMGLGLGIGMRQGGNTGGDQSASAAPRGDAASSHHSQSHISHAHSQQQRVRVAGSDAGMTSISRVDINATPRSEHLDQLARSEHGLMRPSSADVRCNAMLCFRATPTRVHALFVFPHSHARLLSRSVSLLPFSRGAPRSRWCRPRCRTTQSTTTRSRPRSRLRRATRTR